MTRHFLPTLAAVAVLLQPALAQEKPELKDPKQRGSYAIGVDIGRNMKRQELDVDPKLIGAGLADGFAGKPALSDADLKTALEAFRQDMVAKMQAQQKVQDEANRKAAPENLKKGEEFLTANAKKDGVKTTASGLQYKTLKAGSGATPKLSDTVKVHYHGTLIDGTVFDSSVDRGEPISFQVNGVIPGWTEALQLMKVGDKWQLFIPAKLAYGEQSPGGKIGPNSTLLFDVELLGIEKAN